MRKITYIVIAIHFALLLFVSIWKPSSPPLKKRLEVREVKTVRALALSSGPATAVASKPKDSSGSLMEQNKKLQKPKEMLPPSSAFHPTLDSTKPSLAVAKEQKKQVAAKQSMQKVNGEKIPLPSTKSERKKETKEPLIPLYLLKELEETVAKIEVKGDKIRAKEVLSTQKLSLPKLSIAVADVTGASDKSLSPLMQHSGSREGEAFISRLVETLTSSLCLPESGEVKLKVTLSREGRCLHAEVLESSSGRNERFLVDALFSVIFPPFTPEFKGEKEHTFVIAFCER